MTVFPIVLQCSFVSIHQQFAGNGGLLRQSKREKTPWPESARELHRQSDRRLSANLVPTLADRGCYVVSVMDPYGRILGFLDRRVKK
jgi:hypothetical protein